MINKFIQENKFSFYAPFFRLFICFYLLKDVITMWRFNDLVYKGKSFLEPGGAPFLEYFNINTVAVRANFDIFYTIYIILILLFMFGVGKRLTALLLFISIEVIQNLAWLTLNGGDNILKFAILYFIFIDSYNKYSLKPLKYKTEFSEQVANLLSNLAGYSLCIHFCLVYFISAIHKINAEVWFNGIATYYVLGSERFQGTPWNSLLVKNGVFVTLSTYGTILVELLFPFLVWNKKLKFIMLFLAMSLHFGIGIFMMLYDFQILFILILGFFITNNEWKYIFETIDNKYELYKENVLKLAIKK
ncbi:HTTM domain-containing protein [Tenacibaculum sp. 190524A02b]|uniref:HTTM domain-containing protein n=1 Tax=Tenacibaculum vairaonense TaxID=3137860 RepID=A0ABM9PRK6_9FLAO